MNLTGSRRKARPGAALKKLRIDKGWTLADLSQRTGLPASSISKMENGKTALTLDKLLAFSEALDVDLSALLSPGATATAPAFDGSKRRSISRAGDGEVVETPRGNYLYLASELLQKQFIPIIGDVLARDISTYGEYSRHDGEEFVYVLSGTLELHTEMYTPAVLQVGDSVFFDSGMRHAYIAAGEEPCRIISICATTDPYFLKMAAASESKNQPLSPARAKARKPPNAPHR
jgi:transcriptional regulator with XRE-family HTH domain